MTLLLLDTHAFIWWLVDDSRLSRRAHATISDQANDVFVSAVSAWEMSLKYRLGKLPNIMEIVEDIPRIIVMEGFRKLPISVEDANRAGLLSEVHRDPFDRKNASRSSQKLQYEISNKRCSDSQIRC